MTTPTSDEKQAAEWLTSHLMLQLQNLALANSQDAEKRGACDVLRSQVLAAVRNGSASEAIEPYGTWSQMLGLNCAVPSVNA